MKKEYTVEIRHCKEGEIIGQVIEILEFQRDGLTRRDMENIIISLRCTMGILDNNVRAEVHVNGVYSFMVCLWRDAANPDRMHLGAIQYGKMCQIRDFEEDAA